MVNEKEIRAFLVGVECALRVEDGQCMRPRVPFRRGRSCPLLSKQASVYHVCDSHVYESSLCPSEHSIVWNEPITVLILEHSMPALLTSN
jgi:hypothetical protein